MVPIRRIGSEIFVTEVTIYLGAGGGG